MSWHLHAPHHVPDPDFVALLRLVVLGALSFTVAVLAIAVALGAVAL